MRRWLGPALAILLPLAAAAPAHSVPAAAVAQGNVLLRFDTASPGTIESATAIAGLGMNETVRGIDQRPDTLGVYVSTVSTTSMNNSVIRTYRLDIATSQATLVGFTAAALAGAGDIPGGYDFNPQIDRIRYVSSGTNDENARLSPNNGALAGNDTDLNPFATTDVIAEAYDRNVKESENPTLWAINRSGGYLSRQGGVDGVPSANAGTVTNVRPLAFNLHPTSDGGLDISRDGSFYAALTDDFDDTTRLYTLNADGDFIRIGMIGNGASEVRSLTILEAKPFAVAALIPAPPAALPPAPPDVEKPIALLAFDARARVAAFLRKGLKGGFSCSETCTASARLELGKTTLATAAGTLAEAGVGSLRLKRSPRARQRLRPGRTAKTKLKVTFTDAAGNASQLTRKVTLR